MAVRTGNWKQNAVIDGNGFQVTVGTFSTPIQGGGAGTILDSDQPELRISVPSGTSIIPTRVRVDCQTPRIGTFNEECEILIVVDRTQAITDGTGTAETAINMRTDNAFTTACTITSAITVNMTDSVKSMELAHRVIVSEYLGTPANALWGSLWEEYDPNVAPLIVGPATLLVYWGGTVAVTGFCSAEWIEATSTDWF